MGVYSKRLLVAATLLFIFARVDGNCWAFCNVNDSIIATGVLCEVIDLGSGFGSGGAEMNYSTISFNDSTADVLSMSSYCELSCNTSIMNTVLCLGAIDQVEDTSSLITALSVNEAAEETLSDSTFPDLPLLTTLEITGGSLTSIASNAFMNLPGLVHLNLSDNSLTELNYSNFMGLTNLTHLDLSYNDLQTLDEDLEPFFRELEFVNLADNYFKCDCCLEWLFDCGIRDIVTLGVEQCRNSAELNLMPISMLNMKDVCPNCEAGMMRANNSCSRNCTAISCPSGNDDEYYDLEFWMIALIGAGAGALVIMILVIFFCIIRCYCCKKKGSGDRDMVKLTEDTDYVGVENYEHKEKTPKKSKMRTDHEEFGSSNKLLTSDHSGGGKSKLKWKRATRKAPTYVHHENIYDLDEVDSKFEAFYLEEVSLDELSIYTGKLSFVWYDLGQRLGLDQGKLDTINLAIGDQEERCLKMLQMWKESDGPVPHNWESFLNALRSGQTDIEHSIANDIYNAYSIKNVMGHIYSAIQSREESSAVWESWNFFLIKAEESQSYCKAFLDVKGLDLLLHCNQLYTSDWELKSVFFYILDTIAVHPSLQTHLLRSDVMFICQAAFYTSHYPIVSFTAGSVLTRLAYEGDDAWCYLFPNRNEMLNSLSKAMDKWNINHDMQDSFQRGQQNIDYLVQVALCQDEKVAYWGIWALANHCLTNAPQYCAQLRSTGKLSEIEQLRTRATSHGIKQKCAKVIDACGGYSDSRM